LSRRDVKTICDTKGFYIARRSVLETPKVSAAAVKSSVRWRQGEFIGRIINKRRGARGEPGLYGDAMAEAVGLVLAARLRSRAFLRSGWISAIKKLEPLAEKRGAPRADRTVKQVGQAKGYAQPAVTGVWITKTIIANLAQAKWDKGAAQNHGMAALDRAFAFETQSMRDYIERKMKAAATKAGVRHR
jgi:hypothetical protein